jgi:hypothetical protein
MPASPIPTDPEFLALVARVDEARVLVSEFDAIKAAVAAAK